MTPLETLEAEAIEILREAAAECERPVLLFSGGKDSTCLLRLAEKAFRPARFPFPLLHIDTGHNFPELIEFREKRVTELGERLIVRTVDEAIAKGIAREAPGETSRNRLQTPTLLAALSEFRFDCAIGGARRDEEKARAKERVFSLRDAQGRWHPERQRPELWTLYNARVGAGEHLRVFPLSNWTERDIWEYIRSESLEVPSLYFSHRREVVRRDGQWLPVSHFLDPRPEETTRYLNVRVRTIADMSSTGCLESEARSVDDILHELESTRVTERGGRADDRFSETAMEDRKREGYF